MRFKFALSMWLLIAGLVLAALTSTLDWAPANASPLGQTVPTRTPTPGPATSTPKPSPSTPIPTLPADVLTATAVSGNPPTLLPTAGGGSSDDLAGAGLMGLALIIVAALAVAGRMPGRVQ
jgi:hypothetical protein